MIRNVEVDLDQTMFFFEKSKLGNSFIVKKDVRRGVQFLKTSVLTFLARWRRPVGLAAATLESVLMFV